MIQIIRAYTREAGLRNLEREIGRVCRKVARAITEGNTEPVVCTVAKVRELLGPERFFSEVAERTDEPGVAVGLAWTPNGGDILFIEATRMAGKKGLILTGLARRGDEGVGAGGAQLGALARRRSSAIPADFFESADIHLHVPAGAIPKDGPSAGVTMATAITSLLTGRPVRPNARHDRRDHAARQGAAGRRHQGEGARRAARRDRHRSSCRRRNEKDLEDVPARRARRTCASTSSIPMDEVLAAALAPRPADREARLASG